MIFKKIFLSCLLPGLFINCFSQDVGKIVAFLGNDEKPVPKDKAVFFVKTYKVNPGDSLWERYLFYAHTNHPIRSKGKSRDSLGLIKQGNFEIFFPTRERYSIGSYENNEKTGEWKSFFKTGLKESIYHYEKDKMTGSNRMWYEDGKIMDSFMLDNKGNGQGIGYHPDGSIKYKGEFAGGLKKGKWDYFFKIETHQKSMEAFFEKDSLITSVCYTEKGETQNKDCVYEKEAEFKKGINGWMEYLVSKLEKFDTYRYLGPHKKYVAIVKFAIDTEGKTSDIEVENPGNENLDGFAKKVIGKSPAWLPAIQYNQKVKAYRRQPITFMTD